MIRLANCPRSRLARLRSASKVTLGPLWGGSIRSRPVPLKSMPISKVKFPAKLTAASWATWKLPLDVPLAKVRTLRSTRTFPALRKEPSPLNLTPVPVSKVAPASFSSRLAASRVKLLLGIA